MDDIQFYVAKHTVDAQIERAVAQAREAALEEAAKEIRRARAPHSEPSDWNCALGTAEANVLALKSTPPTPSREGEDFRAEEIADAFFSGCKSERERIVALVTMWSGGARCRPDDWIVGPDYFVTCIEALNPQEP